MEITTEQWVTAGGYALFVCSEVLGWSNCSTNSVGEWCIKIGKMLKDKAENQIDRNTEIDVPAVTRI